MLNRILVALILVPLTVYIYLYGDKTFIAFIVLLIGIGMYEIYQMMESKGIIVNKITGIILGGAIPLALYSSISSGKNLLGKFIGNNVDMSRGTMILILGIFILMFIRIYQNKVEGSSSYIGYTMLGVLYVGFLFSHIVPIKYMLNGSKWLMTIQILVWISDTFAYLVGVKFGRKIFSRGLCEISPKKSIEGSLGSIIFTVITMLLVKGFLFKDLNISGIHLLIVPVLVAITGQIGDLAESVFKREFGVKDSGKILGGHGGILDRYDSLIWVFPLMYYYINFFL
ncbi:MAG: phosphatidate cytidylyltransferase [Psychrilyobacter sp.]|uniref:phosphatidate cytidylyltransferase n=1 Tax=Psychrilyobacter sp. TaxID=2586924 RepID=UPI003C719519